MTVFRIHHEMHHASQLIVVPHTFDDVALEIDGSDVLRHPFIRCTRAEAK